MVAHPCDLFFADRAAIGCIWQQPGNSSIYIYPVLIRLRACFGGRVGMADSSMPCIGKMDPGCYPGFC